MIWISANQLTTDMVERHEEDLTEMLMEMLELSQKKRLMRCHIKPVALKYKYE